MSGDSMETERETLFSAQQNKTGFKNVPFEKK